MKEDLKCRAEFLCAAFARCEGQVLLRASVSFLVGQQIAFAGDKQRAVSFRVLLQGFVNLVDNARFNVELGLVNADLNRHHGRVNRL